MERTLTIVKPDSVAAAHTGDILAHLEAAGFRILAVRRMQLTTEQAMAFYEVHRERPFYESLVEFMTSGPVVAAALERDNAVLGLRETMGSTDPAAAEEGTIRARFGSSIERNAIPGSDSPENARIELAFFFSRADLIAAG